jgi:hypothetical protein
MDGIPWTRNLLLYAGQNKHRFRYNEYAIELRYERADDKWENICYVITPEGKMLEAPLSPSEPSESGMISLVELWIDAGLPGAIPVNHRGSSSSYSETISRNELEEMIRAKNRSFQELI